MNLITLLGSTGSIGTQTLQVVEKLKDFKIFALSAHNNTQLLCRQIRKFKPKFAVLTNSRRLTLKNSRTQILYSQENLKKIIMHPKVDIVVNALSGSIGIIPTLHAIKAKKQIALANKESLVSAGPIIMREVKKNKIKFYPIDSEHSAIWQCLHGEDSKNIKKIILTCSGGPFRGKIKRQMININVKQALNHPKWKMGGKISIDSATLMNKGLEVIEAAYLFNLPPKKIEVIIHPESIIHSMVEFEDGCIKANLSSPDMKQPIQHALTYPERKTSSIKKLDFKKINKLTFQKPDLTNFPSLSLAYKALRLGNTYPAVLNAANEIAVKQFLSGKIKFLDIYKKVKKVFDAHQPIKNPNLKQILAADKWAREQITITNDEIIF